MTSPYLNRPLRTIEQAYSDRYSGQHPDGGPTIEVVRARHKAAVTHKCSCGKKKDPTEIKRIGSRSWINCYRCLGQIKQLS